MPRSNNRINSFKVFEANLKGNRGLSDEYLDDIKRRGEQESTDLQNQGANIRNIMQYVSQMMDIQGARMVGPGKIQWNDLRKKQQMENLVIDIINKEYGSLIDTLDVDLDFKLVDDTDTLQQGAEEMQVSAQDIKLPEPKEEEEVTEEDILAEVDKRKLINNITQGSAKNVHRLIHLYKNEIDEIDSRLFDIMDKLIKSQESFEWDPNNPLVNSGNAGRVLRDMMNGYAKVEFNEEDDSDEGEEESNDEPKEYKRVTLKARAIDIVVLLHESIKAIYELIGTAGIIEDEEIAKIVMDNTDTLDDEFEDLRYGVYIRRDLLNFVSVNPMLQRIDNGFEYVWGRMVEMPTRDFLDLFKAILIDEYKNKPLKVKVRITGNQYDIISGTSRQIIDIMIDIILDEFEEYQRQMKEYEDGLDIEDTYTEEEYDTEEEYESSESWKKEETEIDGDIDYSELSQRELNAMVDDIFDKGGDIDTDKLDKIRSFLK